MTYPENRYAWESANFSINALYERVNEIDFFTYSKVVIEMKGETGSETFDLGMKDVNDPQAVLKQRLK
ncbi:MAG: hypothetical protein ACI9SG_000639 [Maribacter sp.]|jgi:hypothetical protein